MTPSATSTVAWSREGRALEEAWAFRISRPAPSSSRMKIMTLWKPKVRWMSTAACLSSSSSSRIELTLRPRSLTSSSCRLRRVSLSMLRRSRNDAAARKAAVRTSDSVRAETGPGQRRPRTPMTWPPAGRDTSSVRSVAPPSRASSSGGVRTGVSGAAPSIARSHAGSVRGMRSTCPGCRANEPSPASRWRQRSWVAQSRLRWQLLHRSPGPSRKTRAPPPGTSSSRCSARASAAAVTSVASARRAARDPSSTIRGMVVEVAWTARTAGAS